MGVALEIIAVPLAMLFTVMALLAISEGSAAALVTWGALLALLIYVLVKYLRFAKQEEPPGEL